MIDTALCRVLVGREQELAVLEEALVSTSGGQGQFVAIGGEAGMGKTRLCREAQRRATDARFAVLLGSCQEADLSLPYLPFMEAIGNHLATIEAGPLRDALGSSASELGQLFPELRPPGASPLSAADDPSQAKLRLYEAIMSLLRAIAGERGLLLVLEDIHWADASTRELLDYLTRRIRTSRVMFLATYRRDEVHRQHPLLPLVQGWERSGRATVVELEPLSLDGVDRMVSAIFDLDSITGEFRDLLHRRTDGNPFVLEETLKFAIDRGDIYRTADGWDRRELKDLAVPPSVAEAVVQRVARLGPDAVDVLRAASVIGRTFAREQLVQVSGKPGAEVDRILEEAVRQQLLEVDPGAEERYSFRHALTAEAVYRDIIPPRRRALHGVVADLLATGTDTATVDLVHHLVAAGRAAEALPLCIRAGDEASGQRAYSTAAEFYERALAEVEGSALRAELLVKLGGVLALDGQSTRCRDYLRDGIDAFVAAGDDRAAAPARLVLGRALWETQDAAGAEREYKLALETLLQHGPSADLSLAYMRLSGLRAFNLEYPEGKSLAQQAIKVAREAGAENMEIWSLNFLGVSEAGVGDLEAGLAHIEESFERAMSLDLRSIAINALYNLVDSRAHNLRAPGTEVYVEAVDKLRDDPFAVYTQAFAAGTVHFALGELKLARGAFERALADAVERGVGIFEMRARAQLARTALELGDISQPEEGFFKPTEHLERQELPHQVGPAVQLALARGDVARAVQLVEELLVPNLEWLTTSPLTIDVMVEALVAGDRVEQARAIWEVGEQHSPEHLRPYLDRANARLALADGRAGDAQQLAGSAAAGLGAAGQAIEALHGRLLLAQATELSGDREAGAQQLEAALHAAEEMSAGRISLLAGRALGKPLPVEMPATAAAPRPVARQATERMVTVMFADLRDYTGTSSRQAPDRTVDQLRSLHRLASQAVTSRHGVVDKFAGDAVMATFNVSETRLDHAALALEAALTIVQRAAMNNLAVGIGLAVGPAVVGELTEGANLSVIGEATNMAARLQAAAGPGEILLSAEAHRRTSELLGTRKLVATPEKLALKGFAAPVEAYRVSVSALGTGT